MRTGGRKHGCARRLATWWRASSAFPALLGDAEKALAMLSNGGLRLHPDTVRALAERGRSGNRSWLWALWTAVAFIAVIAASVV